MGTGVYTRPTVPAYHRQAVDIVLGNPLAPLVPGVTTVFATVSLVLCLLSFMVLGKTAEMGTIWGTLLSLAASIVGMTGVLLATALWAIS